MQPNDRRFLIGLIALTLLIRGGVLIAQKSRLDDDIDAYRGIAEQLVQGEGFSHPATGRPTAFRPPLYPLLLAGVLSLGMGNLGIAVLHLLLGVATVLSTWRLGLRLNLGNGAQWAAVLIAFDPLLIQYSTVPMTETLCTFFSVLALNLLVPLPQSRRKQIGAGAVLGLCILSRPTFLAFAGLMILVWIVQAWKAKEAKSFPWSVLLGMAVVTSPWMIRNQIILGRPKLTTTHGGYTLLLGNNPVFYREVVEAPWGTTWKGDSLKRWQNSLEEEMKSVNVRTELGRDRWMYERARRQIAENPGLFFRACLLRFLRFWNVLPPETARDAIGRLWNRACELAGLESWKSAAGVVEKIVSYGIALFYGLLIGSFAIGVFRLTRREWPSDWPMVLLIAGFCAVHLIYWSNTRMRAPVMPAIGLLAVRAWTRKSQNHCSQ